MVSSPGVPTSDECDYDNLSTGCPWQGRREQVGDKMRIVMKRYLILILAILVLASGLATGCGFVETTPQKQSRVEAAQLSAYITEELSITQRHRETFADVSKAIQAIYLEAKKPSPDDPSKTQSEAIDTKPEKPPALSLQALTVEELLKAKPVTPKPAKPVIPSGLKAALISGIDTLDWALERVDSEILNYEKRSPPPEAKTYHRLMREVLLKERKAYNEYRSYYNSFLQHGKGDIEALTKASEYSMESVRLKSIATDEFFQLWKDSIIER
jgi:hypothetical protein